MKRLPRLSKSGILTPVQWDGVAKVIEDNFREVALQPGVGYTLKNSPGGASLVVGGKGTASAALQSFDVIIGSDENGTPTATIVPGTLNGILPSNMFDSFTLDATSTWYFKAGATTDGTQVTAVEIYVDQSPPDQQTPVPQALPAAFDKLFALVKAGKVFRMIPDGSITVASQPLFTADRETWTPGKPMTETWYSWAV
jgi:hypothetical protein